jgi:hypothetical protein
MNAMYERMLTTWVVWRRHGIDRVRKESDGYDNDW